MTRLGYAGRAIGALLWVFGALACTQINDPTIESSAAKSRTLPLSQWHEISRQDLAILLPRDRELRVSMADRGGMSRPLFEQRWLDDVADTFAVTDVRGAFYENPADDWQIASVRIDPCSPLGRVPGDEARRYCWPEVRVVWQPTLFDHHLGWTTVEYFSEDRAIHASYWFHPAGQRLSGQQILDEVRHALAERQGLAEGLESTFHAHQQRAISSLLGASIELRDPQISTGSFKALAIRAETRAADETALAFKKRLMAFLGHYARPSTLHTLTAFSLPPGRDPEGINSWVFLAFTARDGQIARRDIEVASARTGQTLVTLTHNETVAAHRADPEIEEMLNGGGDIATELEERVLYDEDDLARLADVVNDPDKPSSKTQPAQHATLSIGMALTCTISPTFRRRR